MIESTRPSIPCRYICMTLWRLPRSAMTLRSLSGSQAWSSSHLILTCCRSRESPLTKGENLCHWCQCSPSCTYDVCTCRQRPPHVTIARVSLPQRLRLVAMGTTCSQGPARLSPKFPAGEGSESKAGSIMPRVVERAGRTTLDPPWPSPLCNVDVAGWLWRIRGKAIRGLGMATVSTCACSSRLGFVCRLQCSRLMFTPVTAHRSALNGLEATPASLSMRCCVYGRAFMCGRYEGVAAGRIP